MRNDIRERIKAVPNRRKIENKDIKMIWTCGTDGRIWDAKIDNEKATKVRTRKAYMDGIEEIERKEWDGSD